MKKVSIIAAVFSYILILVIVPLLFYRDDEFVYYHAKQGVILLLLWAAIPFVLAIPLLGWIAGPILAAFNLFLMASGIINAEKGLKKPLILVGKKLEHLIF